MTPLSSTDSQPLIIPVVHYVDKAIGKHFGLLIEDQVRKMVNWEVFIWDKTNLTWPSW